jgi:hypothetical protein
MTGPPGRAEGVEILDALAREVQRTRGTSNVTGLQVDASGPKKATLRFRRSAASPTRDANVDGRTGG